MKELLKKYRRDLHMIPELGYEEYKTHAYILNALKGYPCEITEFEPTGVCAYFKAKNSRKKGTTAFRSDMDALSIDELNNVSYASKHKGIMHACGHDGHMSMLLGFAGILAEGIDDLPTNVLLIFQPAEESPGGARAIADSGILENYDVQNIFALHLGPSNKPGAILGRPMEMMARSSELTITIEGKSAHIATPHKGIDSLHIGCLLVNALYEMEESLIPLDEFRLIRFGKFSAGTVRNTIAKGANLEGTLRTFSDDIFDKLIIETNRIATDFEKRFGCSIKIHHTEGYPAILNNPQLFAMAKDALCKGDFPVVPEFITLRKPPMTSDDFSYYLKKVPGLYLFLGTGNKKPLHSSNFDFDESVLEIGVNVYIRLLSCLT
ncbi:MAG TPA: M20 family metallopeptidase [Anaerovoracaceae bacterium]|nr:M20 family metallopeptidase [Anaerovoracaceae bacterium]